DVGYPFGLDAAAIDEPLILPLANQLSVALRNERLHHVTLELRDYRSQLIEHANALIVSVDPGWRITVCNRALGRLTGHDPAGLVGRDVRDWLPPEERARLTGVFRSAFAGTTIDAIDLELVTRTGFRVRTVWGLAPII